MLLGRNDVDPNIANPSGQTPLFIAARKGHEGIVKILLERVDVSSDMTDLAGDTALSQALNHGHDAIVRLLSAHRNLIPPLDSDGFTALPPPEPSDPDQRPSKRIRRY